LFNGDIRSGDIPMRAILARALLGLLLVTSLGTALSACRHTVAGAKEDIRRDTR
jgi:hypothetical protein